MTGSACFARHWGRFCNVLLTNPAAHIKLVVNPQTLVVNDHKSRIGLRCHEALKIKQLLGWFSVAKQPFMRSAASDKRARRRLSLHGGNGPVWVGSVGASQQISLPFSAINWVKTSPTISNDRTRAAWSWIRSPKLVGPVLVDDA
jgi:hypothetical protein